MGVKYDFLLRKLRTTDGITSSTIIDASQVIYNGASPAVVAVGDSPAGAPLAGRSLQDITQEERVGFAEPTFSAFNLSAFNPGAIREIGNPFSLSGNQTFTWTTTSPGNITPNSITIRDMTGAADLATGLANDGSESVNIGTVTFNPASPSTVSQQWRISATDTLLAGFNRLLTVSTQFVHPMWIGVVTAGDIVNGNTYTHTALTGLLEKRVLPESTQADTTSPVNQRYAFVYPASYGLLSAIQDTNNFPTLSDYDVFDITVTVLSGANIAYKAYVLKNDTTTVNFTNTFIF